MPSWLFRSAVLAGFPRSLLLHSEESGRSHVAELGLGDGVAGCARLWSAFLAPAVVGCVRRRVSRLPGARWSLT
jgi:hypothetical protein